MKSYCIYKEEHVSHLSKILFMDASPFYIIDFMRTWNTIKLNMFN